MRTDVFVHISLLYFILSILKMLNIGIIKIIKKFKINTSVVSYFIFHYVIFYLVSHKYNVLIRAVDISRN